MTFDEAIKLLTEHKLIGRLKSLNINKDTCNFELYEEVIVSPEKVKPKDEDKVDDRLRLFNIKASQKGR